MDRKPLYTHLYFQVLTGIALGVFLGHFWPGIGAAMRPLGDGFIKLIRMIIAPIIFSTVVVGIAKMGDMRNVGRIGVRALVYFEIVSTLALVIGLIVINLLKPGVGINANPATLDARAVATYTSGAQALSTVDFLLNIIPTTVVDAFAKGEILQVLFFSVLFGLALLHAGEKGRALVVMIEELSHALFGVVGIIMRVAPIGAFGAMSFTIGQYGIGALFSLGKLMACFYATCLLFIIVVLGGIASWTGFSLFKFIRYIKEEILIALGTSSSEPVLPRMMAKLEHLGCSKSVVGLVIPTGYSFNLDGTSIYMTMAAIFIAQATNTPLSLSQQLGILAVLLLTSKGAAAVTGGGFVTLAATLSAIHTIPVTGLALIVGIDRFMSEARTITNLIGNGVGTIVIAKWDGALNQRRMTRILNGETAEEADHPEEVLFPTPGRRLRGDAEGSAIMIIYGHHHLNVTSVEAHKKFWVHALGGTVTTVGETEAVMFPGVLVLFQQHRPAGGTKGTTVDHVGFHVRDILQTIDRVKAAHFPMVTREEVKSVPPQSVKDDVAYIRNQDSSVAFTMGPDESKVEFVETQDATLPIALHHIHFLTQSADEMRDWYLRTLTASPAMRGNYKTAELPGVSLTFASSATPVVGTKGRTLDHIGFEVKGLEAFCKKLEAAGVEFDRPYASIPDLGLSSAFVTDPWGTSVELTEGLTASGLTSTSSMRPFP